jgi:hypothetical protein
MIFKFKILKALPFPFDLLPGQLKEANENKYPTE